LVKIIIMAKIKINNSITKIKEKNKETLLTQAKRLIKRVESSGLKHSHIAEAILVQEETFSRFMAQKDGYITKRIVTALNEYLNKKLSDKK
jgi:hypothetical protein